MSNLKVTKSCSVGVQQAEMLRHQHFPSTSMQLFICLPILAQSTELKKSELWWTEPGTVGSMCSYPISTAWIKSIWRKQTCLYSLALWLNLITCLCVSDESDRHGVLEGTSEVIITDNMDVSSKSLPAFPLLQFNPSSFGNLVEGVVVFRTVVWTCLSSLTRGKSVG